MKSVFFLSLIFGRDTYQSIRLYDPSPSNIEVVASLGIPLDHVGGKEECTLTLPVQKYQSQQLIAKGLEIEVLISDLTSLL